MISSMTGFGRAETQRNGVVVSIEARSLNHRFLDIEFRMPRNLQVLEGGLRELVGKEVARGRISLTVSCKGNDAASANLSVDKKLAATYLSHLRDLQLDLGVNGDIELQHLLALPDVISFDSNAKPDEEIVLAIEECARAALHDMKAMRLREGEEIRKDLNLRISSMAASLLEIKEISMRDAAEMFQKLKERVASLVTASSVDEGRLETEVALLAEKADVTEECVRFDSHIVLFRELLNHAASEGRKLNFLLQEMHREANTIGSKTNHSAVSHLVVSIKEEVEKLREQIQNIE